MGVNSICFHHLFGLLFLGLAKWLLGGCLASSSILLYNFLLAAFNSIPSVLQIWGLHIGVRASQKEVKNNNKKIVLFFIVVVNVTFLIFIDSMSLSSV